ncbi:hypothetical protein PIB30_012942 [Stylosanthes scabra]|uniref:Ribonuclease H1 N-terminal domain-containing protein n=1 Tax=Stylosanthes scabra TaxID=79078 RepID=A0ABU6Y3F1_9FABA|nr:hypothetical protein [Stylosanthes scabra]
MEDGRYQYYAVRKGRCPGIYTSWAECDKHDGKDSKAPVEGPAYVDAETVQTRLELLQVSSGVTRPGSYGSSKTGDRVSSETTSGSKTERTRIVLEEDMVHMLGRCCSALNIPDPYFYRRETRCRKGDWGVAVAVSLPENERGLSINAFGGVFTDEGEAMQDAAFKLIEKLIETEDLVIRDFNFRIVQRLQAEITELNRRLEMPINERVRELEKANNMMKAELEAFHEACSGYKV